MNKFLNYYLQFKLKLILNSNLFLAVFVFMFSSIEELNTQVKEFTSVPGWGSFLFDVKVYKFKDYENEQLEGFVTITRKVFTDENAHVWEWSQNRYIDNLSKKVNSGAENKTLKIFYDEGFRVFNNDDTGLNNTLDSEPEEPDAEAYIKPLKYQIEDVKHD